MRRPIVDLRPDADVSIYLQRIARKLLGLPSTSAAGGRQDAGVPGYPSGGKR